MKLQDRLTKLSKPLMVVLLRSPLHRLLSKRVMLITYTGRKSGKSFTVPVGYVQEGKTLTTLSQSERIWWRNLRNGAPVSLRLRCKEISGQSKVSEAPQAVKDGLRCYLQNAPEQAKYFHVRLDPNGQLNEQDLAQTVLNRVVVQCVLETEPD